MPLLPQIFYRIKFCGFFSWQKIYFSAENCPLPHCNILVLCLQISDCRNASGYKFRILCPRFGPKECVGDTSKGKTLRKYCPKTCNICEEDKKEVLVEPITP